MTDDLEGELASLPLAQLRADPLAMRRCIGSIAERAATRWAGPLRPILDGLYELGRADLCLARLVEGHVDAVQIIGEAGGQVQPGLYGVWASRSVDTGVRAQQQPDNQTPDDQAGALADTAAGPETGRWRLTGTIRFASGIDVIDRALVPVWTDAETHQLLDLPCAAFEPDRGSWHTHAMDASRSFDVRLDSSLTANRVGPANFYLDRPGFAVGGLRVAACWAGGVRQLLDVTAHGLAAFTPTAHQLRRLGLASQAAWNARSLLDHTAAQLDAGCLAQPEPEIARTRSAAVMAADLALAEVPLIVGPAGLTRQPRLARALADLAVYVRQHHLDRELVRLGSNAVADHEVVGQ